MQTKKLTNKQLARKLAIISLRYCVDHYDRRDLDGLAAEIKIKLDKTEKSNG